MSPPLWEMARSERWDLWEAYDEEADTLLLDADGEDED